MGDKKIIVNSWNEWDPLKHVIVGRADGTCIPGPEPALEAKVPEDSDMRGKFGTRGKDTIDKANQLLDDFSNISGSSFISRVPVASVISGLPVASFIQKFVINF